MSPARRSVNPQQEALDLGLPEPAPVKTKPTNKPAKAEAAQSEPVDSESVDSTVVEPARAGSATRADSATRARQRKKDAPLLSDEQLRTTAELTVRDLAAYARGKASRAELSERAAQRASATYRKALKTLKHSLGPAAHTMTDDAIYELVDIALAARQATQPEAHQPGEPARKAPAQKELVQNEPSPQENETPVRATSARLQKVTKASEGGEQKSAPHAEAEKPAPKKTAPKKVVAKKVTPAKKAPAQKASAKKATAEKVAAEKVAAAKSASAAAEAKSRALARYASEDRIENAPLKKYLPAPSAKAIATHLDLHTVGEMLEYFPRKYLPRGELSSFAELVEGQDVTIIARVVHVSTRTMAARRGKITEVTITDRLSDATGQDAPAGFGAAGFGAGGPVSVVPGRANRPGASSVSRVSGVPAQSWQATGMHNPRINALANSTQNPAAQNPAQGRGAQPASYSGYADSYGQDSFAQDSFAQDSFAQGGLFGVPSMTNPGALIGSQMKLSFFNAWTAAREIREGETMMFSGRVGIYRGEYTLTNPHYALLSKDASGADVTDAATAPVPVYRAPVKLPTDRISGYMAQLLEKVPLKELEDPVPYTIRRARKVPSLEWTYRALHTPDSEDTWRAAQAQMRYREAFVLQSALARLHSARAAHLTQPRPAVEGGLADQLLEVLPYELTEGQQKVGAEIAADLSSESPMNRLLQGDVGSGKTVVALRAMLQVADAGGQSAMLAPTEVLAEQHLRSVLDILGDMAAPEDSDDSADASAEGTPTGSGEKPRRVRVRLLTASMGTRAKRKVLQELADGTAQIVIGTHALLSDEVSFHDLGLVVVDEQHRFGVEQRDGLRGTDGALPHRLVMTATPIPRTVAMTVFGDLDVSVLDTLPAGRQKISTHVVPLAEKPAWASRLWRRAREEIDAGHQVYVVVPKIGEDGDSLEEGAAFFGASSLNGAGAGAGNSAQGYFGQGGSASSDGKVQLTSVASMYSYLSAEDALVGVRIGTLHGRMDPAEKTAVMTAFERGEIDLLISTTVIEVGVNVPNATLMIIMDADRFGISGLHQLRGRVGRGGYAGTCLLVTRQEEGGVSRERLDAVASTTDGFELSRIDLAQRREGDILGAAQSGSKSTLRFLRALADADIIERAREDARSVVEKDPTLAKHPSLARTIDRALDADREAFLGRG